MWRRLATVPAITIFFIHYNIVSLYYLYDYIFKIFQDNGSVTVGLGVGWDIQ